MKEKISLYIWLAKINLCISAFTFGGGYVVVPMVRKYFVERKKLFTEGELMEMAAVAQSTPGAIAINLTALSAYRVAGWIGLITACICALIPPIVILSAVSLFYSAVIANTAVAAVLRGMQAGVAALIVDFIVDMSFFIMKEKSPMLNALVLLSFALSFFTGINVIFILLGSCAVCIVRVLVKKWRS